MDESAREREEGQQAIRVVLIDDCAAVRRGLGMRLGLEPGVEVVGQAAGGEEGVALARALHADVALVDVELPGMDGLEVVAALQRAAPRCAAVMLTLHDDVPTRARALAAGAAAFVGKHEGCDRLLAAIRRAAQHVPAVRG